MSALWSPPPPMCYKINVDSAVFGAQKSVGVVVRDDEGRVMGACCKQIRTPMGAVEAKAKAFERGTLILVNALNETSSSPSAVAVIMSSSLSAFKDFCWVDVSDVKRSGNWPAHLLAKYAIGISDFAVWVEESPSFIDQALLQDVTLASNIQ
ncbi:uncharacterized protein LOC142635016 [Castanea sativa]|uniref:uncharacterized protein LOC142635016 n=1 Tax=Castanea sativa TaxID=21020 RepID=UPI003F64D5EC